jgi:hypothetical protein
MKVCHVQHCSYETWDPILFMAFVPHTTAILYILIMSLCLSNTSIEFHVNKVLYWFNSRYLVIFYMLIYQRTLQSGQLLTIIKKYTFPQFATCFNLEVTIQCKRYSLSEECKWVFVFMTAISSLQTFFLLLRFELLHKNQFNTINILCYKHTIQVAVLLWGHFFRLSDF